MPSRIRRVGIVGAGMGGLLLGQLITQNCNEEIKVILYERDESEDSRNQGYLLGIDETGMNALTKVIPDIYEYREITASKAFNLYSSDLQLMLSIKGGEKKSMAISRRILRDKLRNNLTIHFSKKFQKYEETDNHVIVTFEDGTISEPLDLLVGADGARSRIRSQRIPQLKYEPIGVCSIFGATNCIHDIPKLNSILDNGFARSFGLNGSSILMMKFHDQHDNLELLWVITFPMDRNPPIPDDDDDKEQVMAFVLNHISTQRYHRDIKEVIRSTKIESLGVFRELHSIVPITGTPNPLSPSSRVTLLGDAAHSMTTHRGRGANTTFEDCIDLANMITKDGMKDGDWLKSLHDYEVILFKRGFKNVNDSKQASAMITMSGISAIIRNFIIRMIGFVIYVKSFLF